MQNEIQTLVMPKRFLVEDEISTFKGIAVRIRIWMGKEATTVALVSQIMGQMPPRQIATLVANHVNESMLCFPEYGFLYFEDAYVQRQDPLNGHVYTEHCVFQQIFEYFGHGGRLHLFKPETRQKEWEYLERCVGGPIERSSLAKLL